MAIDLTAVRADTLGCNNVAHFNNAGCSLPPRQVNEAIIAQLRREEMIGGYEAAAEATERIAGVYTSAATLIGASPDEIALMDGATRAWDVAFYGYLAGSRLGSGDRVLVDRARYPSYAVSMIQVAQRSGVTFQLIDDDERGQFDLDDLDRRLTPDVKLVALTHIPTDSGLINPIAEAGARCRAAGVPLLVDACQSVGQLTVDVDELQCDMLNATGRKYLRGPRGTGFLYVRSEWQHLVTPLVIDNSLTRWTAPTSYELQPGARRYEAFERSIATTLGLGVALDYALDLGVANIETSILSLADTLRQRLSRIPGLLLDDAGVRQCGIVTFRIPGVEAPAAHRALAARGINTSVTRIHAGATEPGAAPVEPRVRASVHYYNSEAEIEALASAIEQVSVGT